MCRIKTIRLLNYGYRRFFDEGFYKNSLTVRGFQGEGSGSKSTHEASHQQLQV